MLLDPSLGYGKQLLRFLVQDIRVEVGQVTLRVSVGKLDTVLTVPTFMHNWCARQDDSGHWTELIPLSRLTRRVKIEECWRWPPNLCFVPSSAIVNSPAFFPPNIPHPQSPHLNQSNGVQAMTKDENDKGSGCGVAAKSGKHY